MNTSRGTPDIHRSFQLTDLKANSNKYWIIKAWDEGNVWYQTVTFGRTGSSKQSRSKHTDRYSIENLIRSKLRKGYRELSLAESEVGIIDAPPNVERLVRDILRIAGEEIETHLAADVMDISADQIRKGRLQLQHIAANPSVEAVNRYLKIIPTRLPARINPDDVVEAIAGDLHKQEERLDNIEATIGSRTASGDGELDMVDVVGSHIEEVEQTSKEAGEIEQMWGIDHQAFKGSVIDRIFKIDSVADDWSSVGNDKMLWHGTRMYNMVHILRKGLIVPAHAANGSMFGRGIYFADSASKSMQYCDGGLMFLASVSLGTQLVASSAMKRLKEAPTGYDSVWGKARHTRAWGGRLNYDEFVVYKASQQKLRYIIEWS